MRPSDWDNIPYASYTIIKNPVRRPARARGFFWKWLGASALIGAAVTLYGVWGVFETLSREDIGRIAKTVEKMAQGAPRVPEKERGRIAVLPPLP